MLSQEVLGEDPALSSFLCFLAILDIFWLVNSSLQSQPPLSHGIFFMCLWSLHSAATTCHFSYKGTSHWITDHPNPTWPHLNSITSTKMLFLNQDTFWSFWHEFLENTIQSTIDLIPKIVKTSFSLKSFSLQPRHLHSSDNLTLGFSLPLCFVLQWWQALTRGEGLSSFALHLNLPEISIPQTKHSLPK